MTSKKPVAQAFRKQSATHRCPAHAGHRPCRCGDGAWPAAHRRRPACAIGRAWC